MEENMEKKKSKGKIIALICSLVVVVGLATTGIVMAATGTLSNIFGSKKSNAFDLLAQAPEKLSYTAMEEQLGTKVLYKAILDKGVDLDFKISDLNMKQDSVDLTGFSMNLGAQVDLKAKKAGGKIAIEKNGGKLSAEGYASLDDKKAAFSMPELIPDKAFTFTASDAESQDILNSVSAILAILPDLQDSFEEYLEEQGDVLYDGSECTAIDNGYRVTVPKDSMDEALNQFKTYLSEQSDSLGTIEEKLKLSKGTISAAVSMMVPALTTYTKDFTFEVYEKDDELSGISTSIQIENVECRIRASFTGAKDQNDANVEVEVLQNGTSLGKLVYSMNSKKGDTCEDIMKFVVSASGSELMNYETRQTLEVKNNNAVTMQMKMNMEGGDSMTMTANGSVKNLEPGKCVTLQMDEVNSDQTSSYGTTQSMSFAMEYTLAVLDGDVTMASGEEVAVTPETFETVLDQYESSAEKNMMAIVEKWGLKDLVSAMNNSSSLDPVSSGYGLSDSGDKDKRDSNNSDEDDYDETDYDNADYDYDGDYEGDDDEADDEEESDFDDEDEGGSESSTSSEHDVF